MPPQFWLWTFLGMSAFGVVYWRIAAGQLDSQKSAVMAKQRAVTKTLGPRIQPFVDTIEGWVRELAGNFPAELVDAQASWDAVAHKPGVYFRLLAEDATDKSRLEKAAIASLHDGFTSCFFVSDAGAIATEGPKCQKNADCSPGLLCNEWEVCTRPARPYNMRLAYRAIRVLTSDWANHLYGAANDLEVRADERDLEQVTRVDVPVAIELLQQAKFATIVLDENPTPAVWQANGALPQETKVERVQRLPHMARVGIWDLATKRLLVRWRGLAEGRLVSAGRPVQLGPDTEAARARQANSCMLAWELRERLAPEERAAESKTTASPPGDTSPSGKR